MKDDPSELLHSVVHILGSMPAGVLHKLQARVVTKRFSKFLPDNMNISVSDPVSAMVCAALTFLSTEEGQQVCKDVRSVVVDLINHVHGKVTAAAAPKAA